ncbi:hypothetical protein Anapl_02781 [Anas platyrhynchos]|uniref:Uncharacterized protein n=1 Tax=Anas platyrhynchos TaxID=8839 RepID=R0LS86_ANAPL|nr:hypothetical protein Anapl_02781 [Anas platyrhynchos]
MPLTKNAQLHKNADGIDEDVEDKHRKWLDWDPLHLNSSTLFTCSGGTGRLEEKVDEEIGISSPLNNTYLRKIKLTSGHLANVMGD